MKKDVKHSFFVGDKHLTICEVVVETDLSLVG
jgi:hypothetical protein